MPGTTSRPPWTDSNWLEGSTNWIKSQLQRRGIQLAGSISQPHIRPWSTVLNVPTTEGMIYFKSTSKELIHEAALTEYLSMLHPNILPEILAVEVDRGWMLIYEGGKTLRDELKQNPDLSQWEIVLPIYGDLQFELAGSVKVLLGLGVPDRRLGSFPARFINILEDVDSLRIDQEGGISAAEHDQLLKLKDYVVDLCTSLMDIGIPDSLDHGDFHDGNIFHQDSRYVFFDWGDSSITHPFFSLRTTFVSIENTLGLEEGASEFNQLIDAYLKVWEPFEEQHNLRRGFAIAQRLWAIGSALRWHLVVSPLPAHLRGEYGLAVPSLLQEFLEANREEFR